MGDARARGPNGEVGADPSARYVDVGGAFVVAGFRDLKLVKTRDDAGVRMVAWSDVVGAGWLVPAFPRLDVLRSRAAR